jgi:hypothetical protein
MAIERVLADFLKRKGCCFDDWNEVCFVGKAGPIDRLLPQNSHSLSFCTEAPDAGIILVSLTKLCLKRLT